MPIESGRKHEGPETAAPQGQALTAEFTHAPEAHIGVGSFTMHLLFSAPIANAADDLKDHAFSVTGGTVQDVAPASGRTDLWNLTTAPDGNGDVTVEVKEGGTCGDDGVVCTSDGTVLGETETLTIKGPGAPALTVTYENVPATGPTPKASTAAPSTARSPGFTPTGATP